jgi:hypothetical protein
MTPEDKERQERAEAFEAWRTHPITKQVLEAIGGLAEQCKTKWLNESWSAGRADPVMLADLRARHEVVTDLVEMTFEELEIALEQSERD